MGHTSQQRVCVNSVHSRSFTLYLASTSLTCLSTADLVSADSGLGAPILHILLRILVLVPILLHKIGLYGFSRMLFAAVLSLF